ncbi:uncharacterized protein LOC132889765 isoform X2 [Neoarius graeffei]|uniref:uncharacterized protein LOC132889765 isoform X2 n=1 Tax=Neoarius graeffei TaxID=443677 RepID=UPI00298CDCB8|nr:uncharacterized protein LOC132889765 isoform X2 [Neoarius graeffei]
MANNPERATGPSEDDGYIMAVALLCATKSPDPRTKVGACIVNEEGNTVGVGYNKMPNGCKGEFLKKEFWEFEDRNNKRRKHWYVCHAVLNAIMNKTSADVKGCTIYVTLFPCNECAKAIIQSGIRRVVYQSNEYAEIEETKETEASLKMLKAAGITHGSVTPADEHHMAVARQHAEKSPDPRTKVGACIVDEKGNTVGLGYNKMPNGCEDKFLEEEFWELKDKKEKRIKHRYVCHAELNAIMNKTSMDVKGCTIYVTLFPCNECAKVIIQSGIRGVVYLSDKNKNKGKEETEASRRMLETAGITHRSVTPADEHHMAVARQHAEKSPDPRTKVGACIVDEKGNTVGVGYNKMPNGCEDKFLEEEFWELKDEKEKRIKHWYVCHAVLNAIMNKTSADVKGCTIYVTLFPCNECAKAIIQSGIRGVVYLSNKYAEREETKASRRMLETAGITHRQFESKEEIFALLKSTETLLKSIDLYAE